MSRNEQKSHKILQNLHKFGVDLQENEPKLAKALAWARASLSGGVFKMVEVDS